VAISCLVCGGISIGVAIHYNNEEFSHGLVNKSRIVHGRLDAAAKFVAQQGGLKAIISQYTTKYKDSSELTEEDKKIILKQVPIYAAMVIGAEESEKDMYNFRVFSDEPRNIENKASAHEMEIFQKFLNSSELKEYVDQSNNVVTVYRPVRITEKNGCLTCHGNPSTSPWGNGKDILGYKMENWADGKLHGVFAISNNISAIRKAETQGFSSTFFLGVFITLGGIVAMIFAYLVVRGPIKTMTDVVDVLSDASAQVSTVSTQIAGSSQDLSESTTQQSASLQETAASLEELTAMVSKNTENAKKAAESSVLSQEKAELGKQSVEKMLQAIDEINQSNEAIMGQIDMSNQKMEEIVKVIQDIGNKTKVINDIVFQTKLLSFNASVEAARAGEHGKGFAVVAEEVGNLAQMSGNAAKEITDMLGSSISKVEGLLDETKTGVQALIEQGKEKVEVGVTVANQCNEVLNEIVTNVSEVSAMASEISGASQEQAQGISEINKAVAQLEVVTQRNSTTSQQAASSAEVLYKQASTLTLAVGDLITTVQGRVVEPTKTTEKIVKLKNKKIEVKSNITPIRTESVKIEHKKASGESFSPRRTNSGFEE